MVPLYALDNEVTREQGIEYVKIKLLFNFFLRHTPPLIFLRMYLEELLLIREMIHVCVGEGSGTHGPHFPASEISCPVPLSERHAPTYSFSVGFVRMLVCFYA